MAKIVAFELIGVKTPKKPNCYKRIQDLRFGPDAFWQNCLHKDSDVLVDSMSKRHIVLEVSKSCYALDGRLKQILR